MKSFAIDKYIKSCKVTKDLIEKLEDYLLSQAINILEIDEQAARDKLKVRIVDGYGTSEVNTIRDEPFTKFSDDTSEIVVKFSKFNQEKYLSVDIRFNKDKIHSKISINVDHENSRELAIGMYQNFLRIVEPSTTKNCFFHPPAFIDGAFFGLMIPLYLPFFIAYTKESYLLSCLFLLVAIMFTCYVSVAKKVRPYIGFDSKLLTTKDEWWSWFLKGILGFIIFTIVLGTLFKLFSKEILKLIV